MNFIKTNLSFFHYILLFASFSLVPLGAFEVQNIPVQSEGRIKPLDTFARNMLLRFYGKREIKDQNIKASDWLLDLILDPEYDIKFRKNIDESLTGLPRVKSFSFSVSSGIMKSSLVAV